MKTHFFSSKISKSKSKRSSFFSLKLSTCNRFFCSIISYFGLIWVSRMYLTQSKHQCDQGMLFIDKTDGLFEIIMK